ncbi:MAG: hypothetical protein AAF694_31065 [Bacteroidota bacterium]
MNEFGKVYIPLQILSIDVVLGALLTGNMGAMLLQIDMPWAWWIVFPISIWIFYTGDHLLDAYRLGEKAHTLRHRFHYKYFTPLFILVCLFLILVGICSFSAPKSLWQLGFILGCLGCIHLGLSYLLKDRVSKWIQKELGVAIIYTVGVWGGPAVLYSPILPWAFYVIVCQFLFLALINLLLFSIYEMETDTLDGHTSFVRAIGRSNAKKWVGGLLLGLVILSIGLLSNGYPGIDWIYSQTIVLIIGGIFLFILLFPQWFGEKDRYRVWGDGAFLVSALFPLATYLAEGF